MEAIRNNIIFWINVLISCVLGFPLFWMISTSFKSEAEANAPKPVWIPSELHFDAYQKLLDPKWIGYISNSLFVAVFSVFGTLISVTIVAYAFSRFDWPGRNFLFYLMMATLMLPPQTTLVPQYVIFNKLGWINSYNPITIPGYFAGGASMIFLIRQFMLSLPKELDEAALLDGATRWQTFWHIILPLCRPIIITVFLFLFVGLWNSLQAPLIYLQKNELHTLPQAIVSLFNPNNSTQPWPMIMATSLVAVFPLIIIFLSVQRYFVESIVLTGSKG